MMTTKLYEKRNFSFFEKQKLLLTSRTFLVFSLLIVGAHFISAQCNLSGIQITSILADPNSSTNNFDTDGDGNFEDDDEFIEICNTSGSAVDISGWTLGDDDGTAFTFPSVTTLAAGDCAILITQWDGAAPIPPLVFNLNTGSPYINNGGDVIILSNGASSCQAAFGGEDCPMGATNCDQWGTDTDGCAILAGGADCAYIPSALMGGLPIELISFELHTNTKNAIELLWSTATEENNDYFIIEHSKDGRDFESIKMVDGNGTSTVRNDYNYMHKDLPNGWHYYRIVQVDFDGTQDISFVKSVKMSNQEGIKIFPTLASNILYIESKLPFENSNSFEIINLVGQSIIQGKLPKGEVLQLTDISNLQLGKYYVRIFNSQTSTIMPFVKM